MAKKTAQQQPQRKVEREEEVEATASRKRYNIDPQRFVEIWETSENYDEVQQKLKEETGELIDKTVIAARVSGYRQKGIKLKKLKRSSSKGLDVEGLNRLIEQLNRPQQQGRRVNA